MNKTVYVVGGDFLTVKLFQSTGWAATSSQQTVKDLQKAEHSIDLICFTGGEDISPYLYGEENVSSRCDPLRDEFEKEVYEEFVGKVPMVGICRGGQFLNVMNGGKLVQDHGLVHGDIACYGYLEKHGVKTGMTGVVRVDHHQGILAGAGLVLHWIGWNDYPKKGVCTPDNWPAYTVWYSKTRCLCFQPHPEWGHEPTKELFFDLLKEYIG